MEKKETIALSIGMIVKNEAAKLEKCLKALQPLQKAVPCELVIADTGSTDGTRAIAEKYADQVFDFPWINDFSAARNAVMDRCNGTWFLTVDADEYLDSNIDPLVQFVSDPKSKRAMCAAIIQRNYSTPDMSGEYSDFTALRILRMDTGIRYEGIIHEHWTFPDDTPCQYIDAVFHHDGYAYASTEQAIQKAWRNLKLLEIQLEENPNNALAVMQCLETSVPIPDKAQNYARWGMKLLQQEPKVERWDNIAGPMSRKAVDVACRYEMPEWDAWMTWAENTLPNSPYITIDVTYLRMHWLHQQERYAEAIQAADRFLNSVSAYQAGKYHPMQFLMAGLSYAGVQFVKMAHVVQGSCYFHLGDVEKGLFLLSGVDLSNADNQIVQSWMRVMETIAEHPAAAKTAAAVLTPVLKIDENQPRQRERRRVCLQQIASSFRMQADRPNGWKLYADLPIDMGRCARICLATTAQEAQETIDQIVSWDAVVPKALAQILELGAMLPDSFYARNTEDLHDTLTMLIQQDPRFALHAVWHTKRAWSKDIAKVRFGFEMVSLALQALEIEDTTLYKALIACFRQLSDSYLHQWYHPDLLRDETHLHLLPNLHRFIWYFLRSQERLDQGNISGCVHDLRMGLEQAPKMKNMVAFLLDCVEKGDYPAAIAVASPELLELAEKVKAILSAYAPDDPMVQAIKESDAYRKVAYLIEDSGAQWLV